MIDFYYDWYNITKPQLKWLILLYNWSVFPTPDTYAITGRINYVKQFSVLGLVEALPKPTCGGDRLVCITQRGKEYLEKVYPVELILHLLRKSKQEPHVPSKLVLKAMDALVKRLPLGCAPIFLTHSNSNIREIGKRVVDQSN